MKPLPLVTAVGLALLSAGSLAGSAVFAGILRGWPPSPLVAELRLHPFSLPAGFGVESKAIADFLVGELKGRAQQDVAMSVILGEDGSRQLADVILPRLVNPGLIERMVLNIAPLATVLAVAQYKSQAEIVLSNSGTEPMSDVALTLPGALRAETAAGPLKISELNGDLRALRLPDLGPHQSIAIRAWLDRPVNDNILLDREIRVGARGVDGSVLIYGRRGWSGEQFETTAWARWLVWAILLGVGLVSLTLFVQSIAETVRSRLSKGERAT